MAWAIEIPRCGKFGVAGRHLSRLNGEEVPWRERLEHAWDHELTDEQKGFTAYHGRADLYASTAMRKFSSAAQRPDLCGPIWDHESPHAYVLERPMPSLQPFSFQSWVDLLLHERALAVVRALEPEANLAFPLEVRTKRGKVYEGPYYGLAVTQLRDALLLDRTAYDAKLICGIPSYKVLDWDEGTGRMAVSEESRNGAHLWRERRFMYPEMFMSDALREALLAADIPLYRMHRVEEV